MEEWTACAPGRVLEAASQIMLGLELGYGAFVTPHKDIALFSLLYCGLHLGIGSTKSSHLVAPLPQDSAGQAQRIQSNFSVGFCYAVI